MFLSECIARSELFDDVTKSYLGVCKKVQFVMLPLKTLLELTHWSSCFDESIQLFKKAQSIGPVLRSEIRWVVNALEVHVLCLLVSSQVCARREASPIVFRLTNTVRSRMNIPSYPTQTNISGLGFASITITT